MGTCLLYYQLVYTYYKYIYNYVSRFRACFREPRVNDPKIDGFFKLPAYRQLSKPFVAYFNKFFQNYMPIANCICILA